MPVLLHEVVLHHLVVLLGASRVQILAMGQEVLLVYEIILAEAGLLLVREFLLPSGGFLRLLGLGRGMAPLPKVVAHPPLVGIDVCVPVERDLVFCGLIGVDFVHDKGAEDSVLALGLGLECRLLGKLGCVRDPHGLVGLHRDGVRCLYPHPDSVKQALLGELGSEGYLHVLRLPGLVRSRGDHSQTAAHLRNLDVFRGHLLAHLVALLRSLEVPTGLRQLEPVELHGGHRLFCRGFAVGFRWLVALLDFHEAGGRCHRRGTAGGRLRSPLLDQLLVFLPLVLVAPSLLIVTGLSAVLLRELVDGPDDVGEEVLPIFAAKLSIRSI